MSRVFPLLHRAYRLSSRRSAHIFAEPELFDLAFKIKLERCRYFIRQMLSDVFEGDIRGNRGDSKYFCLWRHREGGRQRLDSLDERTLVSWQLIDWAGTLTALPLARWSIARLATRRRPRSSPLAPLRSLATTGECCAAQRTARRSAVIPSSGHESRWGPPPCDFADCAYSFCRSTSMPPVLANIVWAPYV